MCYCMRHLTKLSAGETVATHSNITICLCCFAVVDATKTQFYRCEVVDEICIYRWETTYSYGVCDTCFHISQNKASVWNDKNFIFVKLASIFDVITTKINSITNQIDAKTCMKHV
eukprot:30580_1